MADPSGADFVNLLNAVLDILDALDAFKYNQGTMEAALIEAQGATWAKNGVMNHATKLSQFLVNLTRLEDAAKVSVNAIRVQNPAAGARLKDILQNNVFRQTNTIKAAINQTLSTSNTLRQTNPERFKDVTFFEGGAGTNVSRTASSLPSEQLKTMALRNQLATGVKPTLLPEDMEEEQRTISLIRQMPVTAEDIKNNIKQITGGFIAAVRLWVSQFMASVNAALRLAMIAAEEAIVGFGSRLTSPVIFINAPWRLPSA
jgi:hypothetical protein